MGGASAPAPPPYVMSFANMMLNPQTNAEQLFSVASRNWINKAILASGVGSNLLNQAGYNAYGYIPSGYNAYTSGLQGTTTTNPYAHDYTAGGMGYDAKGSSTEYSSDTKPASN